MTATAVGVLTGFLGVGGGFLVGARLAAPTGSGRLAVHALPALV